MFIKNKYKNKMPESKQSAIKRAKELNMDTSLVTKAKGTNDYFIAPRNTQYAKSKHCYADCREQGGTKELCAAIAHKLDNKLRKKYKKF